MKVSLDWLSEMVELPPVEQLAQHLTMSGLEVETVDRPGVQLAGIVVAEILAVQPHPDADRLKVTQVSTGEGPPRQVVCGAKNVRVGDRVPLATPGTVLPGGRRIETASVRGVESAGMLCAASEIGLADTAEGLLVLPAGTRLGVPLAQALGQTDTLFELNVTPNRPDAMSHLGVAREISALTGKPLRPPALELVEVDAQASAHAEVRVEDPKGCPRYGARVIEGLTVQPSPAWLQTRLKGCGVRPINNVVDVTNFVLLELGHPLHAFDLDRLAGTRVVARRAKAGERLRTLDGKERMLDVSDLVIADSERAQALAGVMGGADSEVTDHTTRVLLEAAYFAPASVRRTARRHFLHTEASHRFERGADPFAIPRALDRAAALLVTLGGGRVLRGRLDAIGQLPPGRVVGLRYGHVGALLGVEIAPEEARRILLALGFQLDVDGPEQGLFTVPSFRVDVAREEDLIEEIARVYGYDKIPAVLPQSAGVLAPEGPEEEAERRLRTALAGAGFDEVVNYSFISPRELEVLAQPAPFIHLSNPISAEQSVLRTTLLAGLLQNLSRAVRHQVDSARLYELGRVYRPDPQGGVDGRPAAKEPLRLGGLVWGRREGRTWAAPDVAMDFFDAKGAVENVLGALHIEGVRFEASEGMPFHPRATAAIRLASGERIGQVGELHPSVCKALDLPRGVFAFEVEVASLYGGARLRTDYHALPRQPAVLRDLAVVVAVEVAQEEVRSALLHAGGEWVEDAVLFDQYVGKPVPEGKKNLAFALRYRVAERTLTDTEVAEAHERIVRAVNERFGASLRGG